MPATTTRWTTPKRTDLPTATSRFDSVRLALKERSYNKFKKALGAKTAARFIQLENRMNLLADLQLVSNLSLMK